MNSAKNPNRSTRAFICLLVGRSLNLPLSLSELKWTNVGKQWTSIGTTGMSTRNSVLNSNRNFIDIGGGVQQQARQVRCVSEPIYDDAVRGG